MIGQGGFPVLVDARSLEAGSTHRFDVCVIGAGPAGMTVARELRGSGLSVGLLESGGFEPDPASQTLYRGRNIGHPYFDLDNCRVRYFGGSTNWWVAMSRPLDEFDFQQRSWVPDSGWPFSRAELDPYYERASPLLLLPITDYRLEPWVGPGHEALPLSSDLFDTGLYTYGTQPLWNDEYRDEFIKDPAISVVLYANALELVLREGGQAVESVAVGTLSGRKFRVEAREFVLATGGIENPRILLASNRQATAGIGNQHGLVGRYFMEHPNATIGTFTPRDPSFRSDLYARHRTPAGLIQGALIPTPKVQEREQLLNISISFEPPAFTLRDFFEVLPGNLGKWIDNARLEARKRALSYRVVRRIERAMLNLSLSARAIGMRSRLEQGGGASTNGAKAATKPMRFRILVRSEQHPNPLSRVTLGTARDQFGIPRPEVDWRLTALDYRTITWTRDTLAAHLKPLGTVVPFPEQEIDDQMKGGWHHMGTTRMAVDPRQGVVDPDCRVHGVGNLSIAGSSVYPTSGFVNPTLTLVALAIRLSDRLKRELT
jgi:choline dehydrogenase-like flavoprotein